jgi:hypothetical protein
MTRIFICAFALFLFTAIAAPVLTPARAQAQPQTQAEADAEAEAREAAKRAEQAKEEKAKAPPPAIPGAEAGGVVAPADKLSSDMAPNDALFDAINRGDAASARDALNRGAQLDAKNVLGQTPIDASIDGNRTDITFLLLSMRGASQPPSRAGSKPALAAYHPAAHTVKAHAPTHAAPPTVAAQNTGTPNPAVGFIGF